MNPDLALKKLIDGNKRYVDSIANGAELLTKINQTDVADGQSPFAIILGCSDSRVPVELAFHCGLGDLFVIRVAGNIVAPSQIGSIEFACQHFGTQLVVVLGHSHCGAVNATVDALTSKSGSTSPNVASIVDRITPAALPVVNRAQFSDRDDLIHQAMRANVEHSVTGLQMHSRHLRQLVKNDTLKIIGAEYSLETGVVDFYAD